MKKIKNGFIKNLRYFYLVGIIALGLMTIIGSNDIGGSRGDGNSEGNSVSSDITLPDEDNINTFHGTYRILKMEAFFSNGIYSNTDDWDYFLGYVAIDVNNKRVIIDLYAIDNGYLIFDVSDVRTSEYYDNLQFGGGYLAIDGIYVTEYIFDVEFDNDIYGDFVYYYEKISNKVEPQYFDILFTSSTQATESIVSDDNFDILVGLTLIW